MRRRGWTNLIFYLMAGVLLLLPACTFLSNRNYIEQYPQYKGIKRVAVFIQRWPAYRQLPGQNGPGPILSKNRHGLSAPGSPPV